MTNLVALFFTHFVSDFLLQSREMATKKSSDWRWLLCHVGIIYSVFCVVTLNPWFALANAAVHALIDWHIWKLYKWDVRRRVGDSLFEWRYWEDHWFYATIGFDQFLHGATILLLAQWLL